MTCFLITQTNHPPNLPTNLPTTSVPQLTHNCPTDPTGSKLTKEIPPKLYIYNLITGEAGVGTEYVSQTFAFNECGARVYADSKRKKLLGHAFVEQFLQ